MIDDNHTEKTESLGEFLVRSRKEKNLEASDVLQETKIPVKALRAMEADEYGELPAEAFARGFYSLYAKCLGIDPTDILERFNLERDNKNRLEKSSHHLKHGKRVNTMAARPSVTSGSAFGVSILILSVTIAALCWHFSWNPATYLSEKLRAFQEPTQPVTHSESGISNNASDAMDNTELPPGVNYYLSADFQGNTTATISIDDSFPEKKSFSQGTTQGWYAKEAITLIFPETAKVTLSLNGSLITLPEAEGGFITLSFP